MEYENECKREDARIDSEKKRLEKEKKALEAQKKAQTDAANFKK